MNDIYEQKARKYKYKYLKLKNEYIAEGGMFGMFNWGKKIKTKLNDNDINEQNIKKFLEKLKKSIDSNIIPLYDNGYILGNINLENISLDSDKNVYFDNQNKYLYTNENKVRENKKQNNYPFLLHYFLEIDKTFANKKWLIDFFTNHNLENNYPFLINPHLIKFSTLNDIDQYKLSIIYRNFILPIVKNIDIYGLSMFIYNIFFTNKIKKLKNISNNTYTLIDKLCIDALFNNIDGPRQLSIRLQEIIDSINL